MSKRTGASWFSFTEFQVAELPVVETGVGTPDGISRDTYDPEFEPPTRVTWDQVGLRLGLRKVKREDSLKADPERTIGGYSQMFE